jgi:Polyketide cyclase / dehydrase and lipid transport
MAETYTVVAHVAPEVAYGYIADLTRHPEWSPDDMRMEPMTPGPVAVGSKFKAVGNLVGRPNPSTVEVVRLEAPTRFAFKSTDGNSEWLHEFLLSPQNGGTRIDRRVTILRGPAFLKIVFPVLHPLVIKPGNMRAMGMLRDRLEQL